MQTATPKPFGKFRNFFWPIYAFEHRKLLPILALFFLISFIYNLLRCMKVTIMVTTVEAGAEVIPFLKVWAVLPAAVIMTYLYTKLYNRLNREQIFYTMIILFLGFFTFFLLVLHPHRETLELTSLASYLTEKLPEGLRGLIAIIKHWPLTLFYVLSEMWGAVVLSMLFWGFANEVTSVDEAKRFYAIFAIGANFSGIFSGQSAQFLSVDEYNPNIPFGNVAWEQTLGLQLSAVLLIGIAIIILYRYVNRSIIKNPGTWNALPNNKIAESRVAEDRIRIAENALSQNENPDNSENPIHEKPNHSDDQENAKKLSLKECFLYLSRSRYMIYITILVVAYNIVYNLSDVLWTDQLSQRYPNANEFNAYINHIASITGAFATLSGLLLSGNVIRRYGWTTTAMITPLLWLLTSIGFFGCLLYANFMPTTDIAYALINVPMLNLALLFGSAQISLGRASKYTVFDETKEIAFIPLPKSAQRKGKAVVDGIASRFGKSGGSIIIQVLLLSCGELILTIPYVSIIFLIVLSVWIIAVRNLGKMVGDSIDSVGNETEIKNVSNTQLSSDENNYKPHETIVVPGVQSEPAVN